MTVPHRTRCAPWTGCGPALPNPDPPGRVLVAIAQVMMRRAQSADDAERLVEQVLARKPYPPPLNVCTSIIVTLIGTRGLRHPAAAV